MSEKKLEKKVNPHAGHRERMRERFYKNGLEGFSDHEILEFLLFHVYTQKNTNDLGHLLMQRFGTLSAVFDAEFEELMQIDGIGERAAMLIKLMPEIARKYYGNEQTSISMKKPEARCSYFLKELCTRTDEVLLIGCLTDNLWLNSVHTLASGSPDQVSIDPQKLMRIALASGCSAFVLAHNHPKGIASASYEDIRATQSVRRLLENVRMRLVDHIIVADGKSISMLEHGCSFSEA